MTQELLIIPNNMSSPLVISGSTVME